MNPLLLALVAVGYGLLIVLLLVAVALPALVLVGFSARGWRDGPPHRR